MDFPIMKDEEQQELDAWLASKGMEFNNRLRRQCTDVFYVAQLFKDVDDKLVDMRNYTSHNKKDLRLRNWENFNLKVLNKCGIMLRLPLLENIVMGNASAIRSLLFLLMRFEQNGVPFIADCKSLNDMETSSKASSQSMPADCKSLNNVNFQANRKSLKNVNIPADRKSLNDMQTPLDRISTKNMPIPTNRKSLKDTHIKTDRMSWTDMHTQVGRQSWKTPLDRISPKAMYVPTDRKTVNWKDIQAEVERTLWKPLHIPDDSKLPVDNMQKAERDDTLVASRNVQFEQLLRASLRKDDYIKSLEHKFEQLKQVVVNKDKRIQQLLHYLGNLSVNIIEMQGCHCNDDDQRDIEQILIINDVDQHVEPQGLIITEFFETVDEH